MTLNEAIKYYERMAKQKEKEAKEWHENQVRKCEIIPFAEMDYTHENECNECASEYHQLAGWLEELRRLKDYAKELKELKRLKEQQMEEELKSIYKCFE